MLARAGDADDSSVFAYVGWLMTRGYVPYRDVWDHKGPLLYDVNWLGWRFTPGTTAGIGLLQVAVYALAFLVLIRVLRQSGLTLPPVVINSVFACCALAQWCQGSNMAETWALGAIAASHAVVFAGLRTRIRMWQFVALGSAVAACFWIRPNMCLFPGLAVLALGHMQRLRRGAVAGLAGVGSAVGAAIAVSGLLVLPIFAAGAMHDFVRAYFGYNGAYSRFATPAQHLRGAMQLALVSKGMLFAWLAVLGWVLLIRSRLEIPRLYRVLVLVSLPLEFLAEAISGRPYFHYLAAVWPTAFITAAVALFELGSMAWRPRRKAVAAALLAAALLWEGRRYAIFEGKATRTDPHERAVAAYIDAHSGSADRILPVGDVASVATALRSRREPAGAFIFQLAMVHRANPFRQQQQQEELAAVTARRPKFIFSFPGPVGDLCGPGSAGDRGSAEVDGYEYGAIRELLRPVLAADYERIQSPMFGPACVFERKPGL